MMFFSSTVALDEKRQREGSNYALLGAGVRGLDAGVGDEGRHTKHEPLDLDE